MDFSQADGCARGNVEHITGQVREHDVLLLAAELRADVLQVEQDNKREGEAQ